MPKGPLGFPRLTSIGPLVTDGGEDITLDTAGKVVDSEVLGAFENGDFVEVVRLPKEGSIDIQEIGKSGRATVEVKDFLEGVETL